MRLTWDSLSRVFQLSCCLMLLVSGCATDLPVQSPPKAQVPPEVLNLHEEIYASQLRWLGPSRLWKPLPADAQQGVEHTFAPLILEEAAAARTNAIAPDQKLVVFWNSDSAVISGKSYMRIAYAWHGRSNPSMTGVRITTDGRGMPLVWEAFSCSNTPRIVYVSRHLENTASNQFGVPLPGRRHSVEPDLRTNPGVVVARVLEDGPVPMGPIVYTPPGLTAISKVICRCMPSQASNIVETLNYSLAQTNYLPYPLEAGDLPLRWPTGLK